MVPEGIEKARTVLDADLPREQTPSYTRTRAAVGTSLMHYNNKACIVISVQTYRLHGWDRRICTQGVLPRSTVIMEVGLAWLGNDARAREGT